MLERPGGRAVTGVPFEIRDFHWMIAEGSFNGIPLPEAKVRAGAVGGGGGPVAAGTFPVAELGLGQLRQYNLTGTYIPGTVLPSLDGIISHVFLRRYRWTIDFERRVYAFQSAATPTAC